MSKLTRRVLLCCPRRASLTRHRKLVTSKEGRRIFWAERLAGAGGFVGNLPPRCTRKTPTSKFADGTHNALPFEKTPTKPRPIFTGFSLGETPPVKPASHPSIVPVHVPVTKQPFSCIAARSPLFNSRERIALREAILPDDIRCPCKRSLRMVQQFPMLTVMMFVVCALMGRDRSTGWSWRSCSVRPCSQRLRADHHPEAPTILYRCSVAIIRNRTPPTRKLL